MWCGSAGGAGAGGAGGVDCEPSTDNCKFIRTSCKVVAVVVVVVFVLLAMFFGRSL